MNMIAKKMSETYCALSGTAISYSLQNQLRPNDVGLQCYSGETYSELVRLVCFFQESGFENHPIELLFEQPCSTLILC